MNTTESFQVLNAFFGKRALLLALVVALLAFWSRGFFAALIVFPLVAFFGFAAQHQFFLLCLSRGWLRREKKDT